MSEIVAKGIIEAGRLQQFVDTLTPIVDEAKVHWNDEGLTVRVVDPANVAMMAPVTFDYRAFESYDAPGSATIGFSLTRLDDRLAKASTDQLISLAVDMETRRLRIQYGPADMTLGLIDPESIRREPDLPDLDLPNRVVLSGERFNDAVDFTDMVGDHVDVIVDTTDETLAFDSQGDTDDVAVEYGPADLIDADLVDDTLSVYSIDYFKDFKKAIPSDAEVEIRVGNEFPIEVAWDACEGHLSATATLAPRIQSE